MFERAHHRDIALILQALDPAALAARQCWFDGGTAMVLRHGEYRESADIDFLVSHIAGYRDLRQSLGGPAGLGPIVRSGMTLELAREVRADQYGIRTLVRAGGSIIKLEIVSEGRLTLDPPGPDDAVCGVRTLTPLDMAAGKLLANADRWADDAVQSRDLIDLAMLPVPTQCLRAARVKAEGAYGGAVMQSLHAAIEHLRKRPRRLDQCMAGLSMGGITPAQLWQAIRRLRRALGPPGP